MPLRIFVRDNRQRTLTLRHGSAWSQHIVLLKSGNSRGLFVVILMAIGNPDFTGASRMALTIARAMKSAGHRVIVVTGGRPNDGQASVIDALNEASIETIQESGFGRRIPDRGLIGRISKLAKREGVQCLISEMQQDLKVMVFVAQNTSIRLFYHAQNRVQFSNNWLIQLAKRYLYKRLLKQYVFKVICVSESVRIQHLQDFRIPELLAVTIENGIDLSRFHPIENSKRAQIRSEFGLCTDELMFLNVGRITYQKGQDLLLRSLRNANLAGKKYKLVLVGGRTFGLPEDDKYEEELHRLAAAPELKGKCIFAGWRDDIPSLLLSADVCLHSANWEGLPLAVLEAMAAKLPTVSTDCAGLLTGFIPGVHGYVAKTGDEHSLRHEIEKVLALSEAQRYEMGQSAAKLVYENFDSEITTRRYVELVTEPNRSPL